MEIRQDGEATFWGYWRIMQLMRCSPNDRDHNWSLLISRSLPWFHGDVEKNILKGYFCDQHRSESRDFEELPESTTALAARF